MRSDVDPQVLDWLSCSANPPVQYLTRRDLVRPRPGAATLRALRGAVATWEPLRQILDLQLEDGSFPFGQKTPTAQPTFSAIALMNLCGLDMTDEPVQRVVGYLDSKQFGSGALSYTGGGSGVLPCYIGVVCNDLIDMGALDTDVVQGSIEWLIDHQRFDHKNTRAGGDLVWPFRAPANYGCWESVSCYHGVAGAFRALAAVPAARRTAGVRLRLEEAIEYLRLHRVYKKSDQDKPLFRHMTQFFLVGDYRSDLLDMLAGLAAADPTLIQQDWVRSAFDDMEELTVGGRVELVKNYGRKLIDPIPLEPVGESSRFLTYKWMRVKQAFGVVDAAVGGSGRTN